MTDLNTSNISATTSDVIGAANDVTSKPAGNKSKVVAKRSAASPKSISAGNRKMAKLVETAGNIGDLVQMAGLEIASYTIDHELAQESCIDTVTDILKRAMTAGLQVEMLKASTKNETRPVYEALVSAIQEPREAAGLQPLSVGTRDNYLSRIRAFVRDRGANPLDLFGNLAKNKAKQATGPVKSRGTSDAKSDDSKSDDADEVTNDAIPREAIGIADLPAKSVRGLPALQNFLAVWIAENKTQVTQNYVSMAADFHKTITTALLKS